jgi:hypothetical protein
MKIHIKYYYFILPLLFFAGCERVIDIDDNSGNLPPSTPSGFAVYSAYDGTVILRWNLNPGDNTSGYNIYRSIDDTIYVRKIATVTGTDINYYYDDSLYYNSTYYYKISAVNTEQKESALSSFIKANPVNIYTPSRPANLSVMGRNWNNKGYFYLSWNSNSESDIAGYKIYRSEKSDFTANSSTLIGTALANQFFDTLNNFASYKYYFYKIAAFDKGNLTSSETAVQSDLILDVPVIVAPQNNAALSYLDVFSIKTLPVACTYKIVVSTNPYVGEIWSKEIYAAPSSDNLDFIFDYSFVSQGDYYWKVAAFSGSNTEPNSISPTYKFTIK